MEFYEVAIVGGGAAGLVCALTLCRQGVRNIIILEKNDRLGRKLSQTGNGQGNLTNLDLSVEHYFSSDLKKTERILSEFNEKDTIAFFASIGGLLLPDERGRVYPASKQASSVTDLLRYAIERANVEVRLNAEVKKLSQNKLTLSDGTTVRAEKIVLAVGGKAAKQFGTDGSAYALATGAGHTLTPLYPSLVQCKTNTEDVKTLKGIRVDATLSFEGHSVRGDVIFTDYGISGDAVFRLSPYFTGRKGTLYLELLPDVKEEELLNLIRTKSVPQGELFCGILTNQIGRMLLKKTKTAEEAVKLCKKFPLSVLGTLDFNYAQVTKGGVPMNEVTDELESKKQKGLYLCGEVLDVDGECGGYNLQWAFASGVKVARSICRR